ncbi:hypothetical protein E1301_Tti022474 [Triplophysa tibetana]|uniref:Integrase core domain-containing protein n=1 Tax=Triplophysa tibetana TaxID=1572043 RepID=A0A5A9P4E4_9TELE|nr:hypothetical protein E1301_Tti020761 [Triplophysa tibetana]KAA0710798.1 hypothetical protein E1301_Tti023711 [Triplophysa tibetana]KAA0715547.1 hypothetical protein E1301_Tti010075 [Triplophysa tibetana]KAA0719391.1 hypothetical protein E1301_Tti022474 [Triplophysa tibetana]
MDFRHIEQYFRQGLANREILTLLENVHGVKISNRTLERLLSKHQLWRRKNKTAEAEVAAFIQGQLQTSGQLHGYRWMHQKCWINGIITDRETVRIILRLLDGNGVDLRSRNRLRRRVYFSRGPNYVWHIDGYDKLKPYGIGISGCIDGFSRKMIWLESYRTNSDPRVIAGYFITSVTEAEGCPARVRLDLGTENGHVADMQKFLHNSNSLCVSFGPSTGNQRIERWWLTLRSQCIQFWMNLFDNLKEDGHYADTFLDKCLIQFCFQNLIQEELDEVASLWNTHRIRPVHNSRSPNGRPTIMHAVPQLYGARDYLHPVRPEDVDVCLEECVFKDYPCDKDVFDVCVHLIAEHNLDMSKDVYSTLDVYIKLRELINDELTEEA